MATPFYETFMEPLLDNMNPQTGEVDVIPGWWEAVDELHSSERCFKTCFYDIKAMLPEELQKELAFKVGFWAPEAAWLYLSNFINNKIQADSTDEQSVKIYAKLCNVSEEEMKKMMIANGQ